MSSTTQSDKSFVFFNEALDAFWRAADAVDGPTDYYIKVAGHSICLRFAGAAWVPIVMPALAHLASPPPASPARFTICLWDSASTGTRMPSWPLPKGSYVKRGALQGFNTERIKTAFNQPMGILSMMDRTRNLALCWTRDVRPIGWGERAAPLCWILHWYMRDVGVQLVHGGAVGLPDGGVLLAGSGGAGKSNTALSCLQSDLYYLSDDYCLLGDMAKPKLFSLYSTGKVHPADLNRLPFLAPLVSNPDSLDRDKALFFLHQHFPDQILEGFPLKAIFLPRVTNQVRTTWQEASATDGFRALADVTLHVLPGVDPWTVRTIARIVRKTPCYYLNLGQDGKEIPQVIRQFLVGVL